MCAEVDHRAAAALLTVVEMGGKPICRATGVAVSEAHIVDLAKLAVVLTNELREIVVDVPCFGGGRSVVFDGRGYYLGNISVIVVGVGICCILRIRDACVVAVSLCPRRKEIEDRQDRKCGRDYSCENREFHRLFDLLLLPLAFRQNETKF